MSRYFIPFLFYGKRPLTHLLAWITMKVGGDNFMKTQKQERKISIPESEYRNMRNALRRQEKAKWLAFNLWSLFCNTKGRGKN